MRRQILVRDVPIGGGAPVVVQSMTNTDTADVEATVAQIERLERAGCEIARVAVPSFDAVRALPGIIERISIPLVADIHFDHRLALASIDAGVDKLRLNPGNITDPAKIAAVADAANEAGIPIRVGVNAGSLDERFRDTRNHPNAAGMVESGLHEIRLLEERGFDRIVVSLKGTDVRMTIDAYRAFSSESDVPLHIGITEAGTAWEGSIRSAVGLGVLLAEGLGDTMRVSLTGDPVEEVRVAYEILRALGLRSRGIDLRVCPTCGRTAIDLESIALAVRRGLGDVAESLSIALMGCVVNGPGEAREADVGLVGGPGQGTIYVHGEPIGPAIPEDRLAAEVILAARALLGSVER
jgi:(E)-4-hydroxy-3-methylbut-2-enyl-diphosphate synthase